MILPLQEEFTYKDCVIGGDECILIHPKDMSVEWTDENSRFRSCILRKSDYKVVSQGFRKFTNFGEKPEFEPWVYSSFEARKKLDGSLLIVSKHNDELIIRTRNSVDCSVHSNFKEIEFLKSKYKKVFENASRHSSMLFEWTTPSNIIVLKEHSEPTLTLIGEVKHEDGSYMSQKWLDTLAPILGVGRPEVFKFDSIKQCREEVFNWKGCEGVVIYSPDGQVLKKIKSDEYLHLHRLSSALSSMKSLLESYFAAPEFYTSYEDFRKYVEDISDFEIAERNVDNIKTIIDVYNEVNSEYKKVKEFMSFIDYSRPKSELAKHIVSSFSGYKQAFAFAIFNSKENLISDIIEKAMKEKL